MTRSEKKYRSALKKHLPCSAGAKVRLLGDFSASMGAYLEEYPDATFRELCEAFGPPEEMAAVLQTRLTENERKVYRVKRNILRVIAGFAAALFLLVTVYIYFYMKKPIVFEENIVVGPTYMIGQDGKLPGDPQGQ